ncbi:MAG: arginase [Chitinophagales bacterium]|nr:arginase [Chitinophagales bacterium]
MKNIRILAVKSEIGAGTRGASLGFDAIKIAALDFGSTFFKQYPEVKIEDENDMILESSRSLHARRGKGIITVCERVSQAVEQTLREENFPIVIAGDHSSAAGTIAGIKAANPQARIGVIWIDAHSDLHSIYTTPSGNMHGMPLAISLAEDNLTQRINNPDPGTVELWDQLKNLNGISPKIRYENLVFVSVRDTEPQEDYIIRQHKMKIFSTDEINNFGIDKIAREILTAVEPCDVVYISFDVDSMDPTISRGTGTPAPNGITEKQAAALLQRLMQSPKVCCFEITEVNPTLDKENLMAENVFEILLKVTNQLMND